MKREDMFERSVKMTTFKKNWYTTLRNVANQEIHCIQEDNSCYRVDVSGYFDF